MYSSIRFWTEFRKKAQRDEGFSLIELMVVIVIIGLLTTVVVVNVLPSQDRAMVEKAKADIRLLEQAITMYRMDVLKYPSTDEGLESLLSVAEGSLRSESYIKSLPKDPWGNDYLYLYPGEKGSFDIYSLGADGRPGGDGLNADIGNWGE